MKIEDEIYKLLTLRKGWYNKNYGNEYQEDQIKWFISFFKTNLNSCFVHVFPVVDENSIRLEYDDNLRTSIDINLDSKIAFFHNFKESCELSLEVQAQVDKLKKLVDSIDLSFVTFDLKNKKKKIIYPLCNHELSINNYCAGRKGHTNNHWCYTSSGCFLTLDKNNKVDIQPPDSKFYVPPHIMFQYSRLEDIEVIDMTQEEINSFPRPLELNERLI